MTNLPATNGSDILSAIEKARHAMEVGLRDYKRDRMAYVKATIDVADQIALLDNLIRMKGDPVGVETPLQTLRKALEELEDMIHNPQDKAEILNAIKSRPNALSDTMMKDHAEGQRVLASAKTQLAEFELLVRTTKARNRIQTFGMIGAIGVLTVAVVILSVV